MITETYYDGGKVGVFYSASSLAEALAEAEVHSRDGFRPCLPWLAYERVRQPKEHWVWQRGYDCNSEEDVFVDENGEFSSKGFSRNDELVAIIHGGGLATSAYLREHNSKYNSFQVSNSAVVDYIKKCCAERVYTIDDVVHKIPPLDFPLVILSEAKRLRKLKSGLHTYDEFIDNELVIARSLLSLQERIQYFTKASYKNQVGNWHSFVLGKGRVPHLSYIGYDGFFGYDNIFNNARPVGVAPEAPQRALEWIAQHKTPNPEITLPTTQQLRQQPTLVPGQGYFTPQNVPKPTEPKTDHRTDQFTDWMSRACITATEKRVAKEHRAELENLPEDERTKLLDLLDIASRKLEL